jgi:ABC-type Fe3+/spermidine/putrescine transport system ATPase subunit
VADFIGISNPIQGVLAEVDAATRRAVVQADGGLRLVGSITDPAASPATGDRVTVAIRPERFTMTASEGGEPQAPGGWTAIRGRIRQGTYLGDHTEYRIDTDVADEVVVRRQNALGAAAGQGVGPGDPVVLTWHEEANLVLVG